ncbi:LysM peptidoglycan-binding domain-containing protein [Lacrimispora sp. 210928-DFI.3.58]|uniref:LysM peptidoglycan-binding domain-containing protein n=1 Tax=Lacrimispora sp. 210928-DFI.3.58 TaxID=2883214 RepID=UPI001D06EFD1|nr:LysM domain-containing protein [Lacrimispora sp. 210928-DFI.3.58]MCB7320154.1 LysM peptidoglycan-binding domain-containing protein [Lacrimispora sp. 210928-DFI.3.58]
MGELYEPFPKLPKNIRQIGERDKVLKLYLEDYVNTYLKRLQPVRGSDLRVGLLLGSRETHEDMPFVFVDGALEMESVAQEGEKVVFSEDAWKKAYQDVEQMFPKRTVQGWFLCGSPGCSLSPLNYWRQHSQYFTGKNQLMYLNSGLEGEEAIYITSSDGFYKLRGYSVYYERNQMMQDYMISRKDAPRAETGVNDKAIQDFRQKMDEHRHEAGRQRSTVGVLSGVCSVLAVTVLAGGVAMFNNYRKMHEMESVIASVLPEGSVRDGLLKAGNQEADGAPKGFKSAEGGLDEPDYVIEEAAGKVYPTTAPGKEADRETPSLVAPETMPGDGEGDEGNTAGGGAETKAGESTGEGEGPESGSTYTGEAAKNPEVSGTPETSPSKPQTQAVSAVNYQVYTVEEGETLYGICFKLYQNLGHIDEICRVNALADQNSIYAGQKLLVP